MLYENSFLCDFEEFKKVQQIRVIWQYFTSCFPGLCQMAEETMYHFVIRSLLDRIKLKVRLAQNCPDSLLQWPTNGTSLRKVCKERSHALGSSHPTQTSSRFISKIRSCFKKLDSYCCFSKELLIAITLNIVISPWVKE